MDFELTADQADLQEGVRAFCAGRFSVEQVRELIPVGGIDRERWRELADMGVFSLRAAEADGGVGLGWADAVLVYEELGRAIVPGPVVWTHLLADLVPGAASGDVIVGGIERDDPSRLIEHRDALDALVVLDDDGVFQLDPASIDTTQIDYVFDPLTPVHHATALAPGDRIGDAEVAAGVRRGGRVLAAALQLGVAQAATDLAVAYAGERTQFDRPIGSFQAVKHLLADNLTRIEVARAAVYAAGVTMDDPSVGDPDRAVTAAKLMADEAALEGTKTSIQVHGGMGYTWEVDAHLYFKRAYVTETMFGSRDECADAMAAFVS